MTQNWDNKYFKYNSWKSCVARNKHEAATKITTPSKTPNLFSASRMRAGRAMINDY